MVIILACFRHSHIVLGSLLRCGIKYLSMYLSILLLTTSTQRPFLNLPSRAHFMKCALEGKFKKGLWVDVVNSNIDKYIERYFIPHLNKLPRTMWEWRKQAKMITIQDAYIDFRSADTPETMEGFGYDKAFLNEAGIILKNEYLWNNAIMPMFWDYPQAKVVI